MKLPPCTCTGGFPSCCKAKFRLSLWLVQQKIRTRMRSCCEVQLHLFPFFVQPRFKTPFSLIQWYEVVPRNQLLILLQCIHGVGVLWVSRLLVNLLVACLVSEGYCWLLSYHSPAYPGPTSPPTPLNISSQTPH